jgi:hypothetical protein
MNALQTIHDAIRKIEEAAGCVCFLASECDPKPAMYARLYWEEPKPCTGVVWANGDAWAILPTEHNKNRTALLEAVEALPRKDIYTFIHSIEEKIVDGGRVEFARIADVLYIRVSWEDLENFCWELGIGKDFFDKIEIMKLIDRINTSKLRVNKPDTIGFRRLSNEQHRA